VLREGEAPAGAARHARLGRSLALTDAVSSHQRRGSAAFAHVEVLPPTGDLAKPQATLFRKLRRLDEAGLDVIYAEPVPEEGLGVAIMDRLRKAAGSMRRLKSTVILS
jgi:hypothetical protein